VLVLIYFYMEVHGVVLDRITCIQMLVMRVQRRDIIIACRVYYGQRRRHDQLLSF